MNSRQSFSYVFEPAKTLSIPIQGETARFPVRRIYCIGRNYAAHAIEMGGDPSREPPFFFQKNPDNIVINNGDFPYPEKTNNVHHEIELVVALHKGGRNIPVEEALEHVFGYAVGIDMTRRDLQDHAKKTGRPWETGKAFEHSAPVGEIVPVKKIGHPDKGAISLKVNGQTRQSSDLNKMVWKVPEMISYLSDYFELQPGDLIMSGTPEGVGPVIRGDVMEGAIDNIGSITTRIV